MLKELNKDIMTAMKQKNSFRVNTLKMMKSVLINNSKQKEPKDEIKILRSYKKVLIKGGEEAKKGNSTNLATFLTELNKEIFIIDEYLPRLPVMSKEDIGKIVDKHINLGHMGKIIGATKKEMGALFDAVIVKEVVSGKLKCKK